MAGTVRGLLGGGALSQREFRLLFAARSVSALGNSLSPIAMAFAVLELTGSATDLGIVIAANQGASVIFFLAGGVWADRFSRSRILFLTDLAQAAAQAASAALLLSGSARVWQLAVLAAIYGAAHGIWTPALRGVVPSTVSEPHLQQANSLLSLSTNTMGIAGPALGGVLVVAGSPGGALAFDAGTFLVSAVLVGSMRLGVVPRIDGETFAAALRGGWRAFRSRQWLWVSVLLFCLGNFLDAGPFYVLGPIIARLHLGGAGGWATILTAEAIGSVLGSLLALRLRPSRPLLWTNIGWALSVIPLYLLALPAPLWLLAVTSVGSGAALSILLTFWFTVMQTKIPAESLSRVSSYDELGSFIFEPLSFALVGTVAAHLGVPTTVLLSAIGCTLIAAAGVATPSIRNLRLEPSQRPAP
jgi:MFS family permease